MDCIAFWWGRYGFSSPSTKGFHGRARCRLIDITNLEVWWIKDNLLLWRGLQIRLYQKQRDQIWRNFATLAKLCKSLGNFSKLNLVLEKRLKHLLGNCYAFGSIYIFINGPILKIISPTGHTGGKKSLHSSLWYTLHWRQLCSIYYSTTLYEMLRIVPRPFSLLTNNNTMNERMKEWSVAVGLKILSNYGPKVDLKAAKPLLQIFFPFFHFAVSSFSWQMTI